MVDWSKHIEAVYADGRVFLARVESEPGVNCYRQVEVDDLSICGVNQIYAVRENGERVFSDDIKIRNRAEPAKDELAELRAFKEAAIAKYPELAPVDPDLLEAREICAKNVDSHNPLMIEPYRNGEYDHHWLMRCVREGIERGRELERYAQGLTTPKD